ncbi:hypothetical protein GCM10010226_87230 [Streptomyces phaeofaciens]|uniref:Uncharacterized protein n=2 Tax=Streptomyces phaeofaciens TaxID=68254 RepID=A0A918M1T6_9ACTN|nr:hypothetical protein GCM10010226_87230 [Streptomyces phaeofaciens]
MTRASRLGTAPAWLEQARTTGFTVEHVDERPAEPAMWRRLYRLWIAHADELLSELGEVQARNMLREAHQVLPTLPGRRAVLLTLRHDTKQPATPGTADSMPGLSRHSDERTPQ